MRGQWSVPAKRSRHAIYISCVFLIGRFYLPEAAVPCSNLAANTVQYFNVKSQDIDKKPIFERQKNSLHVVVFLITVYFIITVECLPTVFRANRLQCSSWLKCTILYFITSDFFTAVLCTNRLSDSSWLKCTTLLQYSILLDLDYSVSY